MPVTAKQEIKQAETIFFSTSRRHMITYKKETKFPDGSIKDPVQMIQFDEWEYRTIDPNIINHIKAQRSFTNNPPKVRIVTEDELIKLRMARMPLVTEAKTTTKPVNYLAMAEANGPIEE